MIIRSCPYHIIMIAPVEIALEIIRIITEAHAMKILKSNRSTFIPFIPSNFLILINDPS